MKAPDLIAVLRDIEAEAEQARKALASGAAVSGSSALARIKNKAADAARWAEREPERSGA